MFSVWVEIQAILDQHVAKMIEDVPLPETMGRADDSDVSPPPDVPPPPDVRPPDVPPPAETLVNNSDPSHTKRPRLDPLPLRLLCPLCFGAGAKATFLCLDANFQQNTVKSYGRSTLIHHKDLLNCQVFVDENVPNEDQQEVCTLPWYKEVISSENQDSL